MKADNISTKRTIQLLLRRFHDIERKWDDTKHRHTALLELRNHLAMLDENRENDIPFITRLHKHIDHNISLEHLYSMLVPIEREYNNTNITDSDFLVTSEDAFPHSSNIMPVTAVLDNLRSSFNIGGIFRTCECAGFEKVFLCGYSATPENPKVRNSAMGAENLVAWEHQRDINTVLDNLKKQPVQIIALETVSGAPEYYNADIRFPCAILLGNERFGLQKHILAKTDLIVSIPMYGSKNSMNVASAFSVCACEIRRRWEAQTKLHSVAGQLRT